MLGAGMMGAGIAYVSARAGMDVILLDTTREAADRGKDYSRALLRKRVARGGPRQLKWRPCSIASTRPLTMRISRGANW